ncbi:MAG: tRNA uridine-5-carboxymethylaminomethyl(34) synthesis enzyme MnmG, partial [Candidatus Omnitrophota bacterium]
LEAQHGDADPVAFSFRTKELNRQQMPCYITYTNQNTHDIIRANLNQSPLYAGSIKSRGPRYCPSIEDKIVRFADKQRHQLFLEPEGIFTEEYYINGLSTSFPQDIQLKILRSIQGLENAEVMRYAYAIEYDYCDPTQIKSSLETKKIAGLFFAGQINGTSGYEEAAGQGIMAGINAALKIQNKPSFILGRSEAYIGVMIDDLVTNGTEEPYRMFTSRAEHRLLLRQDNANERLMRYGFQFGLIDNESYEQNLAKIEAVSSWIEKLKVSKFDNISADKYLKRSEIKIDTVLERCGFSIEDQDIKNKVEIEIKYSGYVQREIGIANRIKGAEEKKIPENFEYSNIKGIRVEAREKFEKIRPISLGQATRISGITPCDIALIAVFIEKHKANLRNSK